jgi:hypothetical protein
MREEEYRKKNINFREKKDNSKRSKGYCIIRLKCKRTKRKCKRIKRNYKIKKEKSKMKKENYKYKMN